MLIITLFLVFGCWEFIELILIKQMQGKIRKSVLPLCGAGPYLLVTLLQVGQLLSETLNLHLQVRAGHGQVVQDFPQAIDVSLHALPETQLVFIPGRGDRKAAVSWSDTFQRVTCISYRLRKFSPLRILFFGGTGD